MLKLGLPFFDDRLPVQEIDVKLPLQKLIPSLTTRAAIRCPNIRTCRQHLKCLQTILA